jgi:hypothetical protein
MFLCLFELVSPEKLQDKEKFYPRAKFRLQGRNLGVKIGGGWTHFARQKGVVKNAMPTLSIDFVVLLINKSTICNEKNRNSVPDKQYYIHITNLQ